MLCKLQSLVTILLSITVSIAKDDFTKRSKGYAFIQYTSQNDALLAVENMDQQVLYCLSFFTSNLFLYCSSEIWPNICILNLALVLSSHWVKQNSTVYNFYFIEVTFINRAWELWWNSIFSTLVCRQYFYIGFNMDSICLSGIWWQDDIRRNSETWERQVQRIS